MIAGNISIYVKDRGFLNPLALSVGNQVISLDEKLSWEYTPIDNLKTEYLFGKINKIDSGQHKVLVDNNARHLYVSETLGFKHVDFSSIPKLTRDKTYQANKYLPILSWPKDDSMNFTEKELESVARMIAVDEVDNDRCIYIAKNCSSSDAIILIDMLEFWCSKDPGTGFYFSKNVKARFHKIPGRRLLEELLRVTCIAGYTAQFDNYIRDNWALSVNYESTPIPGSRPKNQKYYTELYDGLLYTIGSGNKMILGTSFNKAFFLPTIEKEQTT